MKRTLNNRASVTLALGVTMARASLGLSKLQLAERAGCSPQHVTDIEGRTRNPSQKLIADLADAVGKTPMEVYQLGEMKLEEQTLEIVRQRRERVRSRQDLEAILEAVQHLRRSHLAALLEAAQKLLDD
jgi:transcriptional regulator with XRE-family HTH domain